MGGATCNGYTQPVAEWEDRREVEGGDDRPTWQTRYRRDSNP